MLVVYSKRLRTCINKLRKKKTVEITPDDCQVDQTNNVRKAVRAILFLIF
jgi:hypothetical protein